MYDFSTLSPLDFEELVRDLLQCETGLHFESFGPGRDSGIDCRHARNNANIIVQAKHYAKSGVSHLVRVLEREENEKVRRLDPSRYILATSLDLSPDNKHKIIQAMPAARMEPSDIYGRSELNNLLRKHAAVENKHFKLWLGSTTVLERILKSGIYNRTDTELDIIKNMIPRFVMNPSVSDAEDVLSNTGTVIISGHPGVGKTTLARMLVWLHAAQGWNIFVVDSMEEAFEIANPGEKRLILFDDFLGQVRLSPDHVRGIDQRLPPFLERVRSSNNLRFILTTRQYILSQAGLLSKRLVSQQMQDARYVLNVGIYTRNARARILLNHLYFSGLSESKINELMESHFYLKIIDHPNFNPRLIELLTNESYSSLSGAGLREAVERTLNNPTELWERPYRDHISTDSQALMIALLLSPKSTNIHALMDCFARMSRALGDEIPSAKLQFRYAKALKELEGSVLAIIDQSVRFSNPGVRDFLQQVVIEDNIILDLVSASSELVELEQCWAIFFDRTPKPEPVRSEANVWAEALCLIDFIDASCALRAFELSLDLYDYFDQECFLNTSRKAADYLDETGVSESDSKMAAYCLENLMLHNLGHETKAHFTSILTEAIANMVRESGSLLRFDEIEYLEHVLSCYGDNPHIARGAINDALEDFIAEISTEMEDYTTTDEVDTLAVRLHAIMERNGYKGSSPNEDLEYRRQDIAESEENDEDETYQAHAIVHGVKRAVVNEHGDDYIRSMFADFYRNI